MEGASGLRWAFDGMRGRPHPRAYQQSRTAFCLLTKNFHNQTSSPGQACLFAPRTLPHTHHRHRAPPLRTYLILGAALQALESRYSVGRRHVLGHGFVVVVGVGRLWFGGASCGWGGRGVGGSCAGAR